MFLLKMISVSLGQVCKELTLPLLIYQHNVYRSRLEGKVHHNFVIDFFTSLMRGLITK